MKRDPKVKAIHDLPAFEGAHNREIRDLASAADIVEFERDEVICRADRHAAASYVVMDGMVDVVAHGSVIATLGPGQIVGELSVIDGKPRCADVVAATDATLLEITPQIMLGLIATNDAMRTAVVRQLTDRLRRADEDVAVLIA